ncbi:Uncharacterised protein [Shimwellia blattae]|nr:Uncharacterised protein [Shimwellia blattae]VEC24077.1 Uncharacterised protein [Shimwellia blattae]
MKTAKHHTNTAFRKRMSVLLHKKKTFIKATVIVPRSDIKLKTCSNSCYRAKQSGGTGGWVPAPRYHSGVDNIAQVHLFRNLLNPGFNALLGQLWLAVFIDSQAHEVVIIHQTFRGFKVVAFC